MKQNIFLELLLNQKGEEIKITVKMIQIINM